MARKGGTRKQSKAEPPAGLPGRLRSVLGGFLFGRPVERGTEDRLQEIKGLALIAVSLWLLISLASYYTPPDDPGAKGHNWGGQLGWFLANGAFLLAGWGGYLAVCLGVGWGIVILARKQVQWAALRLFGALCLVLSVGFLLQLGFGPVEDPEGGLVGRDGEEVLTSRIPYGPGGWLALKGVPALEPKLGVPGLWILLAALALISFMLATEMAFYPAIASFQKWLKERREERGEGLVTAVGRWLGVLFQGLWDFLRGADLQAAPITDLGDAATATKEKSAATKKAATKKAKSATTKKAATKEKAPKKSAAKKKTAEKAAPKKKAAAPADEEAEAAALAAEEVDELEWDDEPEAEEEEWEYEDDEASAADDDEEWEYEDEDGDDEEWEYEDEEELDPAAELEEDEDFEEEYDEEEEDEEVLTPVANKPKKPPVLKTGVADSFPYEPPTPPPGPWNFPGLDLLEVAQGTGEVLSDELAAAANKLENALKSFRVEAEVVAAQVGPAVTLFELMVAQGTRMNKVTQLSQEIAAALKARSVRIIAPIPGRATIGIEVPNKKRRVVRLRELIRDKAYDKGYMALPLFLGMDAEGTPIVEDLARMPHLLIAGTTGSGKSVCINTILASLLLTRSPHDVQMILVDPKMVELQMFAKVPHLLLPVVTDARQATNVLAWACEKMEGRYELLKDAGVKNIKGYNALGEDGLRKKLGDDFSEERTPRHLPYIVVVIDEMADLMMVSKKEAEGAITRLAQKSRAVGIHVIVATQRPSTDVITGVLKGNLPTRIAFQVASKVDSRVILDAMGAEKLLGGGDMLYTPPQASQLKRVQGALVEDHELQGIVDFVCNEALPKFNQDLVQTATGTAPAGSSLAGNKGPDDPMFDDAVRVVLKSKRGSASLLQRALSVGYTRASRLIDLMTEEGILGEHRGSKSREIMITLEDWEEARGEVPESADSVE